MKGPTPLETLADYQDGSIVSRVVIKKEKGNVTVFAFDAGQALSEHTVPHEALVQVLEGQATITVGGTPHTVTADPMSRPLDYPDASKTRTALRGNLTSRRESGGTGRRAGFRILWGNPWEFESPLSHQRRRSSSSSSSSSPRSH